LHVTRRRVPDVLTALNSTQLNSTQRATMDAGD